MGASLLYVLYVFADVNVYVLLVEKKYLSNGHAFRFVRSKMALDAFYSTTRIAQNLNTTIKNFFF